MDQQRQPRHSMSPRIHGFGHHTRRVERSSYTVRHHVFLLSRLGRPYNRILPVP